MLLRFIPFNCFIKPFFKAHFRSKSKFFFCPFNSQQPLGLTIWLGMVYPLVVVWVFLLPAWRQAFSGPAPQTA